MMRRFELVRHADPSGVSGTGVVAQGIQFADGTAALRWVCSSPATSIWDSVNDLISVHGHGGRTVVRWVDAGNSSAAAQPTDLDRSRDAGVARR